MISEVIGMQFVVDNMIKEKVNEPFENTLSRRKIAFHVELGEFANEVGFFKYWKESHIIDNDRVKNEWADCLAFLNSIAITNGFESQLSQEEDLITYKYSYEKPEVFYKKLMFNKLYDYVDIMDAYKHLYQIGQNLGYSIEELNEAYKQKSLVNIQRAKEGY